MLASFAETVNYRVSAAVGSLAGLEGVRGHVSSSGAVQGKGEWNLSAKSVQL